MKNAIRFAAPSRRQALLGASLFGAAACTGLPSPRTAGPASRLSALTAFWSEIAEYGRDAVPGFQIAVIEDGRIVHEKGYGQRREGGPATDGETVFDLGSLTKPVMTAAVMRLAEEGRFDLDRPLAEMAASEADAPEARRVTARHVLTHQTGLPNWRPFEPDAALVFERAPGEAFGYSGEGFFWLQRAVEAETGRPIAETVQRLVFAPSGMKRAGLITQPGFFGNYAQGHQQQGEEPVDGWNKRNAERTAEKLGLADTAPLEGMTTEAMWPASNPYDTARRGHPGFVPVNAAGSLQTTAGDYARFMLAFAKGQLLGGKSTADMLTPRTPLTAELSIGLGWYLEETNAARSFWHSGFNDGFHSFALCDVEAQTGAVCLTNSNRGNKLRWPVIHRATGRGAAAIVS